MKKILVVGDDSDRNSTLSHLSGLEDYRIKKTGNVNKALELLKKYSPDYVMCAGKIKCNSDGKYFLELS